MPDEIRMYRGGALLLVLLLSLLAVVCIAAATQDGTRALLLSMVGGRAAVAVTLTVIVLLAGLFSLRVHRGTPPSQSRDSEPSPLSRVFEEHKPVEQEPVARESVETQPVDRVSPEPIPPPKTSKAPAPEPDEPILKQVPLQWSDEYDNRETKLADVLSYSETEFSLRVSEARFKIGQVAWIADDDVLRRGIVTSFQVDKGSCRLNVHLVARERRSSERVEATGRAHVHWSDRMRAKHNTVVTIRNFSTKGFQVYATKPVREGQLVILKGPTLNTPAKVLYCKEDSGGYLLGMQFVARTDTASTPPIPDWRAATKLEMHTEDDMLSEGPEPDDHDLA